MRFSCRWLIATTASELPSYDIVIPALLEGGVSKLRGKCKLTPGVPLKPMLAKPTKAIGEVLDRFENKRFTCEYKYDGERAQVRIIAVYLCISAHDVRRCTGWRMAPLACSQEILRT